MTKPRTNACSVVFIILSLHTKADRLQNQNHMLVVFITYSSERRGGGGSLLCQGVYWDANKVSQQVCTPQVSVAGEAPSTDRNVRADVRPPALKTSLSSLDWTWCRSNAIVAKTLSTIQKRGQVELTPAPPSTGLYGCFSPQTTYFSPADCVLTHGVI